MLNPTALRDAYCTICKGKNLEKKHTYNYYFLLSKLQNRGYLEKRDEDQMYCTDCETFLPDRYIEGTCPHCGEAGARGDQCEKC